MSGTDWGGKFATISKKAWFKSFLELDDNDEILDALSSLGATQERPISRACAILEKFTCMVYAPKSSKRTLAELRWELFRLKGREGEKLPPKLSSFLPHLWRANYIAMVWKSSRHHVSELPSPLLHGWEIVDDKNVSIKCLKPATPEAMLALVKCGCKRGCSEERHCVCLRNRLACTNACACSDCESEFL